MKKRLFLLLILFCFCMFPKNTYAQSYNLTPNGNLKEGIFENRSIYYFNAKGNYNRIDYTYSNLSNSYANTVSNFSFMIYMGSYNVANPLILTQPIVTINDAVCDVTPRLTNGNGSTVGADPWFGVSCKNLRLNSTSMHVEIQQSGPYTGTNDLYGISSYWDITTLGSNQDVSNAIDENTQKQDEIKNSITSSDTNDASESANSFFGDFQDDDYGLSDVITMPLEFIKGLASSSCSSLNLPLPFVDTNLTLPCMTSIYSQYFGSFLTLYQIITTGFIAYWVCINIFRLVQGFKNPDNDEVEVMEL